MDQIRSSGLLPPSNRRHLNGAPPNGSDPSGPYTNGYHRTVSVVPESVPEAWDEPIGLEPEKFAHPDQVAARALELGLKRILVLARRDLEAPLAGGSELYADKIASISAAQRFGRHASHRGVRRAWPQGASQRL